MHAPDPLACGNGLRACLRGQPQHEQLLLCLANAISSASHSPAPGTAIHTDPNNGGHEHIHTPVDAVKGSSPRPQSALVDEVCGFFASGALPLFVALRGRETEARALFTRLARVRYWRRALLFPQLRRWCDDGLCHPFPHDMLLPPLLDGVEADLRAAWPAEGTSARSSANQTDSGAYAEARAELQVLVQSPASFHALCVGIDVTLRNHIRRLVQRVRARPSREETTRCSASLAAAMAAAWTERVARQTAQSVWADVFSLLSSSGVDSAARESLFVFAMGLLASQSAVLQHMAPSAAVAAVRLLVERLRSEVRDAAASRLLLASRAHPSASSSSSYSLSSSDSSSSSYVLDAFDAAVRHPLLWHAGASAEAAVALCCEWAAPAAHLWARRIALTAWGRAVRAVRALERASTDTVSIGPHAERVAALCTARTAGHGRKRSRAGNHLHAAEFFLRVRDPGGFALLALERQDALAAALRDLHAVVVNAERAAVEESLEGIADTRENKHALMRWHDREVHAAICHALREESPLLMCLLHAVFALAEREGTSSLRTRETLHDVLLTTLAHLCRDDSDRNAADNNNNNNKNNNNDNDNDADDDDEEDEHKNSVSDEDAADEDAVEDYYARRQALAALLASGLLSLPWDPRGLRLRLLLHNAMSDAVSDAFSAEDALAVVDEIASDARLGGHSLSSSANVNEAEAVVEAAAVTVCSGTRHEPALCFLLQLTSSGGGRGDDVPSDEALRAEAPTHFPAPCGALIVLAAQRALSRQLHALRLEWDEQQQRCYAEADAADYLGRSAAFCTSRDVAVFRVVVQLAHRMVFAAQLQPRGLLRLWLSSLRDLFMHVVPPPDSDDEMTLSDPRGTWRALCRSPVESPQAELRAALGELLADLALAPLVDMQQPTAGAAAAARGLSGGARPGSRQWIRQQRSRAQEMAALQRVLPVAVLEEVCAAIGLRTAPREKDKEKRKGDDEEEEEDEDDGEAEEEDMGGYGEEAEGRGGRVEQSFLGVTGVVALCRRLEVFVVPETIADERAAALLRTLWAAIDQSIAGST